MKSRFFLVALMCAFASRPLMAQTQQITFDFVGHVQTWVVPNNVTSVIVDARGAQGGGNDGLAGAAGGKGGRVQTTLTVTPNQTLFIYVGGRGGDLIGPNTAGSGGFNGGGAGAIDNVDANAPSGGGGGASDVRQGADDLADRVVVAGGGGGAECCTDADGGAGGGTTGMSGATSGGGSNPGGGGTQFDGGTGGGGCNGSGSSGSLGQGGAGGDGNRAGGGGGGGHYGGGGGGGCLFGSGGGGGSSFSAGSNTIHTQGFQNGDGQVIITIQTQVTPPQITGLSAIVGAGSIYLRWNPSPIPVDEFLAHIEQGIDTAAINTQSTIASTAQVGITVVDKGTLSCGAPPLSQAPSCLITSLGDGTPIQNHACYWITLTARLSGQVSSPSNTVLTCPNPLPTLPVNHNNPILFLHGFNEDGRFTADTFGLTFDFMKNSLGWNYGGQLYHVGDDAAVTHVNLKGTWFPNCDQLADPALILTLCNDDSAVAGDADFYSVSFGNTLANYGDDRGLSHQGDEVSGFVAKLHADGVASRLSLVAHSNGGLAARDFVTRFPGASQRVAELITYGTPHRGADVDAVVARLVNCEAGAGNASLLPQSVCGQLHNYLFNIGGARDARFTCQNGSIVYPSPATTPLPFLQNLNEQPLPDGIKYTTVMGVSETNGPYLPDGQRNNGVDDCQSALWDGLIPLSSADLSRAVSVVTGTASIRTLTTNQTHIGQGNDFPAILCALDSNCAVFQVSSPALVAPVGGKAGTTHAGTAGLQGNSPVDIDVIAPDASRMGTTFAGIAGASYMNTIEDNGQETTTVLIPLPQGGSYIVNAIPREGSLPTDSFTIMLTQNGVTTTIADQVMIQNIPSDGFRPHVNSRPFANAGADQTVECAGPSGTPVVLNGSLSGDQDGDALTYVWTDSQGNVVGNSAVVTVIVPAGTQAYSLIVTDPAGLSAAATTRVIVRDTTPPVVHLTLTPNNLWPPNHKLVPITANIQVSDVCDPSPTVVLVSITSNEPDSGSGDIQGATFGSDDRSFLLRAERLGPGTGRIYTITYRVTDHSGNVTLVSGQVRVPHDQGP